MILVKGSFNAQRGLDSQMENHSCSLQRCQSRGLGWNTNDNDLIRSVLGTYRDTGGKVARMFYVNSGCCKPKPANTLSQEIGSQCTASTRSSQGALSPRPCLLKGSPDVFSKAVTPIYDQLPRWRLGCALL